MEPDFCEPDSQSREAAAQRIIDETGAVLIHPFNNADVMAGQGTAALELLQQVASATDSAGNTLDTVIVPVGGGGLLAGTLIAIKSLQPDIRVIAAEPAWADDAFRSIRSGQIEQPSRYDTIADGLRTNLGSMTFPVIRELVDDIMLVEEDFIRDAAYSFLNDARLVVEPSGAVPLGCVMQHAEQFSNQRIGIIISGGNIDLSGVTL
jgi:threonine dehydratase